MTTDAVQTTRRVRKERHTEDFPLAQKPDLILEPGSHGESLANPVSEKALNSDYMAELAFQEEPVTIRIEENTHLEYPETHVPCQVGNEQGHRGAEVLIKNKWISMTWLPIGQVITTKRKYVEVLARSVVDAIRTVHDDATVAKPRNAISRRSSAQYPLTIINDPNPKGHEWLTRIRMGF